MTVRLLDLDFDDFGPAEAAALIAAREPSAPFGYVVTPNADHFARMRRRPELAPLYRGAEMRLLDSRVLRRTALMFGLPAPQVCPGSDLTARLLAAHPAAADEVAVVGMSRRHLAPLGLGKAAHHAPPFGFERDPAALSEAVRFVVDHPARYVFLAVGSPRQEILAHAIVQTGRATGIGLCVGASLAFAAGVQARAPLWMQEFGVEWLHRLACEPRRLGRRYMIDSPAALLSLLDARLSAR